MLINLLETKDLNCKLGALSVLSDLSQNTEIRRLITDFGGVEILVKNLTDPARDLQILVAKTIYNVAQIKKARRNVRKSNGIPKLVDLLDIPETYLLSAYDELNTEERELVVMAKTVAMALWSVSQSKKNIHVMMKSGSVPLLARLLRYLTILVQI